MSGDTGRFFESLHLFTIFNLAVSRPLLEILAENAQFFIVRRSPPLDIYLATFSLCLLIPAILVGFRFVLDLSSRRAGSVFHSIILWILLLLLMMFVLKQLFASAGVITGIGIALAGLAVYAYRKYPVIRSSLNYLAPAIVIVPLIFLFDDSISTILSSKKPLLPVVEVNSKTPVTVLVLDELPLGSLLNEQMEIDGLCFPNFKRLQNQSTWYRNASAVSDLTEKGVAAVITGIYPKVQRLPTNFDYPENLFTLLATSYELNVIESGTKFHPALTLDRDVSREAWTTRMKSLFLDFSAIYFQIVLPDRYARAFPPLGHTWRDFWQMEGAKPAEEKGKRSNLFLDFIQSIRGPARPVLNFLHVELPHGPYRTFPTGTEYNFSRWSTPLAKEENLRGWAGDESVARRAFQRYMLQMVYTDHLLGQLIDQLEAQGLYDSSLFIVTADHGICFHPKEHDRPITKTNFVDTLSVPLFVKLPFQKKGAIDDRNAETIDVLPTIASMLGVNPDWKWDGESLRSPAKRTGRRAFSWMHRNGQQFAFPAFSYKDSHTLRMKLSLFGSESSVENLFMPGPFPQLRGKPLNELIIETTDKITAEFYNRKLLENVDLQNRFVPAMISGKIHNQEAQRGVFKILLSVNRIVQSSGETFPIDKQTSGFAMLVPESSFRNGKNEVSVILVEPEGYVQTKTAWVNDHR